jgi:alpha-L-arabinofuranosidase
MVIKVKPNPPERSVWETYDLVGDFDSLPLEDFIKYLLEIVKVRQAEDITVNSDSFDCNRLFLKFKVDEDEARWKIRMERYQRDLDEWNKWYESNKEEVEKELERRRLIAEKRRQEKIKKLEAQLKELKGDK